MIQKQSNSSLPNCRQGTQSYTTYRPDAPGSNRPLHSEPACYPNPEAIDTLEDYIHDLERAGLWEAMVEHILSTRSASPSSSRQELQEFVNNLFIELQAGNAQLMADAYCYATHLNKFGPRTLRDYAKRHGITPEGFRKKVKEISRRLSLESLSNTSTDS